jgi:hypothetical protein
MAELLRGIPVDYEPKRKNRFVLEFPIELGIETWKVQSCTAPKFEQNAVEINYMNVVDYVAGRGKWGPADITLIDTQGPSTTTQLMEWVRLAHESLTGRQGYAAGYKKTLILKALDPTGVEVEKWEMRQCMITSLDMGEFTYDDDGLRIITMTVQPFFCLHNY